MADYGDGSGCEPTPTATRIQLVLNDAKAVGDTYSGVVAVDYQLDAPAAALTLHADPCITLSNITIAAGKKTAKLSKSVRSGSANDVLELRTEAPLAVGYWTLEMRFTSALRSDLCGIYPCGTNDKAVSLATHFEVTEARKAFPCVDDSRWRIPYEVTLTVPKGAAVVGNTPISATAATGTKYETVTFERTQPLPVYVLGFVVTTDSRDGVGATVARNPATPDDAISLRVMRIGTTCKGFALGTVLQHTSKAYTLMRDFFDCDLPHAEISTVAVCKMKISGMENDGIVFLSEAIGDLSRKKGGTGNPAEVLAQFVAHEMAHHWMGNVVGLPFTVKEGVCLVLERHFGDILLGNQPRKVTLPKGGPPPAPAGGGAAVAVGPGKVDEGKELTGHTYQLAEHAMLQHVARVGWDGFRAGLRRLCVDYAGAFADEAAVAAAFDQPE